MFDKFPNIIHVPLFSDWLSVLSFFLATIGLFSTWNTIKWISNKNKNNKKIGFWQSSLWNIYLPRYSASHARIEDILSFSKFQDNFLKLKLSNNIIFDDQSFKNGDSIYICGSDANKKSKDFSSRHSLVFEIKKDIKGVPFIYDRKTNNNLYSPMDSDGNKTDLAIIGHIYDEQSQTRHLFCWGIHGVGTYGAAIYACSQDFIKEFYKFKKKNFIFVVNVIFDDINSIYNVEKQSNPLVGGNVYG